MNVKHIALHVAAEGNDFMDEIASWYAEGFRELGLDASVRRDEIPCPADDTLSIIVAPHEFSPLFLEKRLNAPEIDRILKSCCVLNTEQPGSSWFDVAVQVARECHTAFDINVTGCAAMKRRGLNAFHAPLGITDGLGKRRQRWNPERSIDLVFLGHNSNRRGRFFSEHARLFHSQNCRFIIAPVDRPRREGEANYLSRDCRDALLTESKILLSVHSTSRTYFEWHRAILAVSHGAVLVMESSEGFQPLEPGRHFVMAPYGRLAETCQKMLGQCETLQQMSAESLEFLRTAMPIRRSCEKMLEAVSSRQNSTNLVRSVQGNWLRTIDTVKRSVKRTAQFAKHNGVVHWAYAAFRRRRNVVLRRDAVLRREQRRSEILTRLRKSRLDPKDSPYSVHRQHQLNNSRVDLSVVITLYNYHDYIAECIKSVVDSISATPQCKVEIIVVDDASEDRSAEIATDALREWNVPSAIVRKVHNTGLADARNTGIRVASGKFVFILDADNVILPGCLQRLYQAICTNRCTAAYGIIAAMDGDLESGRGLMSCYDWDPESLVSAPYIDAMAIFDREVLMHLGGYDTELLRHGWFGWEDYELWLRLAESQANVVRVPEIIALYRQHSCSMIHHTNDFAESLASYLAERYGELEARFSPKWSRFGVHQSRVRSPRHATSLESTEHG
jgi:GT2 family glycosyltransferase